MPRVCQPHGATIFTRNLGRTDSCGFTRARDADGLFPPRSRWVQPMKVSTRNVPSRFLVEIMVVLSSEKMGSELREEGITQRLCQASWQCSAHGAESRLARRAPHRSVFSGLRAFANAGTGFAPYPNSERFCGKVQVGRLKRSRIGKGHCHAATNARTQQGSKPKARPKSRVEATESKSGESARPKASTKRMLAMHEPVETHAARRCAARRVFA